MKDEKRHDFWELQSSGREMAHFYSYRMPEDEGKLRGLLVWEQVGRRCGQGSLWPVGMISESHFDDKVKVTPSKAHFGQR